MKKILVYMLLTGLVSSCIFPRKKNNIGLDVKYDDTTALKPFIFKELKAYMAEIDSLPLKPPIWRVSYALLFDTNHYKYLDIFALYPVMPYHTQPDRFSIGPFYYNDNFRLVGCFYRDTVLINGISWFSY